MSTFGQDDVCLMCKHPRSKHDGTSCPDRCADKFVLFKRELFWRPNGRGYTSSLLHAGIYEKDEVPAECWSASGYNISKAIPLAEAIDTYIANGMNVDMFLMVADRLARRS